MDRVTTLGGADLVEARFVRSTPPHSHQDVEIGVVVGGQRLVKCRGRGYRAPTGTVVIFNPGEIHAGAPLDATGSSYRAFLISAATLGSTCDWLAESSGGASLPWFENPVVSDPELAEALADAHLAIATHGADQRTDAQLAEALASLVRRHRRPAPPEPPADHTRQAVQRVQSYLEDNYHAIRVT